MTEVFPAESTPQPERTLLAAELCATVDALCQAPPLWQDESSDPNIAVLDAFGDANVWGSIAELERDKTGSRKVLASLSSLGVATEGQLWVQQVLTSAVHIAQARGRQQMAQADIQKARLLEGFLGLAPDLSTTYVAASRLRHRKRDDNQRLLSPDEKGGVNVENWARDMARFTENVLRLGPERTRALNRYCGIVNFDRYEPAQLERMARFIEGDEDLLTQLRNSDVTLMISEVVDDNDALGHQTAAYENDSGTTLFFEAGHPAGIYRALAMLRRAEVLPSTLVLASHSVPGCLAFGNGRAEFDLLLAQIVDEKDLEAEDLATIEAQQFYNIEWAQVARVTNEYMRPSRITGERSIVLSGCLIAIRHKDHQVSVPEAIARMTYPEDRVVVSAPDCDVGVLRDDTIDPEDDKVYFWDYTRKRRALVHTFIHLLSGAVVRDLIDYVPGTR